MRKSRLVGATLDSTAGGRPKLPTTQWGLVVAASAEGAAEARAALEELYRLYCYPVYAFIRRRGHGGVVNAVAISPGNRWVVTGSVDKTARLWDLTAKDPSANPVVLRGHERPVNAVAISPDNHWVVTGSDDNTARLWFLRVNDLMNLARITVGRNFSTEEWRLYFPGEKYRKTFPGLPGPD